MSADKIADRVLDVCRRLTLLAGTAVLAAGGSLPALSAMASDNGLSVHADDGSGTTAEITPGVMVARVEERGRLPVIVELRVDVAPMPRSGPARSPISAPPLQPRSGASCRTCRAPST
ncbi:MAG: hypothetical protein M5U16_17115 [Hyphomicrobium sp.]|nr:hypothetical protein [Hyphomicrobium sp.]